MTATHTLTTDAGRSSVAAFSASVDEALISRVAAGDRGAMRTLFSRHQTRVYRFVLRMIGDPMTAEDVVSETFFDVWRQAGQFEARSSVSTWILAIARFKALSACRRRTDEALDPERAEVIEDPADTPEVAVQRQNRSYILRQCLRALPAKQAEIMDLVYYHEKSVRDVAKIVGVPENTVKTRMFAARKRLAELLAASGIDRSAIALAATAN